MNNKTIVSSSSEEAFIDVPDATAEQLALFDAKLRAFNWDYALSDCPRDWEDGLVMQETMFTEATRLGMEAMEMYFEVLGYPKPT